MYYFLGDVRPTLTDLYRLNGYGNLEEVRYNDIENIIEEIENRIENDEGND